jgi:prefoldin subunit 5
VEMLMSIERELAVHETEIKHLQADMDKLVADMDDIKKTLNAISNTLAEARGGWKALMFLGGAGGVLGSAITYFVQEWIGK